TPRQIYLSGSVRLADGSIPPTNIVIERVCAGSVRPEAYTDSKGNFHFLVGSQNTIAMAAASIGNDVLSRTGRGTNDDLTGCEIRASLPGFISESVIVGFRRSLDDPDIGIIRIRRLANVEGYTYSLTTAQAPKDARKAYEKGLEHVKKQK